MDSSNENDDWDTFATEDGVAPDIPVETGRITICDGNAWVGTDAWHQKLCKIPSKTFFPDFNTFVILPVLGDGEYPIATGTVNGEVVRVEVVLDWEVYAGLED